MADYDLTQTGQEVQDILDGAAMQTDLTAETQRAELAEQSLQGGIDAEETRAKAAEKQNADDIDVIESKIPAGASDQNQLADKDFVNNSIATATATYRGAYNLVNDLSLTVGATHEQIATALAGAISTADNNDYCFVQIPTADATPTQIASIERYKFNGTVWAYEYTLNNSGFTAAQWAALNSGITSGLVAKLLALPTNDALALALAGKQDVLTFDSVPVDGSNNPVKSGGVYSAIGDEETRAKAAEKANADDIDDIEALIPAAASDENQLADKEYVNSSISTATATYRGSFNEVNDLSLNTDATHEQIATALAGAISTADNNDYCFVQIPTADATPTQIASIERYKFNGTAWAYEYTLNNSGFTAAQWAALNSGITSGLVAKLSALPTNDALTLALAGKQDVLTFDNEPTSGSNNPVKSGGVYDAIDVEATTRAAAIAAIVALIPEAASALNQLADKSFVNSSISTATAVFKGTYNVVVDLELSYNATQEQIATMLASKIISADNNDYCFVQIPTSDAAPLQIARTDRYKFNGTAWAYEYTLNNSGFTTAQWAAINSGITSLLKDKLIDLPTATELTALLAAKQNQLTFDTTPTTGSTNPVTSGGVKTAIDAEKVRAEAAEADRYTKSETYNKTEINGMVSTPHQNYVTVPTYASLPSSGQSTDTIYRVSSYDGANNQVDDTVYSEYAWDGTQYVFLRVNSQIEEVFDITVYNSNTKYADLSAALGVDGANIPATLRRGGMSVKFVQSSDNKYVQYRLISDSFNTDASNWMGDNADTDILNIILTNTDSAIKTINEGDYNEGLWLSSDNSFYSIDIFNGIFIPCEQYKQFILTPSVDNVIAFLKSKPTAAGDVADYASDSSRTSVTATTTIEVPIDAKYLYIDTKYQGTPLPCTIQGYYKEGVVKIVDKLSKDNEKTDSLISEKTYNNVDILEYETPLWLSADNSFYAVSDDYKGAFIPCNGNRLIEMTSQSQEIASFAFLTEKPSNAGEVAQYADGSYREYLPFKGRTPYDTKYIYISTKSENVCSSTIKICNVNENIVYNNPESSLSNTYADMNNYISNKCISNGDVLNFIFFSDPHTLGISNDFNQSEFDKYLLPIKDLYDKERVDFVLCGGDWLNAYDTQEIAAKKLLYLNKTINDLFGSFYNMVGNHDTNYRGYINSESQTFDGIFSNKTIRNLLFDDKKNCYYSFEFGNTKCYVLDTGTDAVRGILSYEKEQLDWLASELHNNNNKHVLIAFHIYSNAETSSQWNNLITDFGQAIMNIALAFNSKTTVIIDGDTYDFTSANGTIACFLCGHTHFDYIDETTNVPVICIADERNGNIPTYDLVSLDFGAAKAYMKRYGSGQNREVNIVV